MAESEIQMEGGFYVNDLHKLWIRSTTNGSSMEAVHILPPNAPNPSERHMLSSAADHAIVGDL